MGLPQNFSILGFAKQSAHGTAATVSTHRVYQSGGQQMHAEVTKENFLETNGYQTAMDAYNSHVEGKGAPDLYLMPSSGAALFFGILGADTPSGSGDPYSHAITEAAELPYWTVWGAYANGQFEMFVDCKMSHLKAHGEWGKPLMLTPTFVAGVPQFLSAAETTATLEKGGRFLYYDGKGTLKVEGVAVPLMRSFDLDIDRGVTVIPGDGYGPNDSLVGAMAVTLGITTLPSDFKAYNRVVYGGESPSNNDPASTTPDTLAGSPAGFELKFTRVAASPGPERSIKIAIPNVQRDPFTDALSATPGPLVRTNTFQAYKPSNGATIATVTLLNGDATIS